jgi:hypothetical protein
MAIEVGKDYLHFKGEQYIAVVRAKDAETEEPLVVYTKNDGQYWVRTVKNFEEEVTWLDGVTRPRFMRTED